MRSLSQHKGSPSKTSRGPCGERLLDLVGSDFLGLETMYPTLRGGRRRRCYLDSAASTLMMGAAHRVALEFLSHYSNSHSELHYGARIAGSALSWARQQVLDLVAAAPAEYTCLFCGSGSTAGFNALARMFTVQQPERDTVLVSHMEHHSNDLPHRQHARRCLRLPLVGRPPRLGGIDLSALSELLSRERERVNYVAVSAASNATGIMNPFHDIAELAHRVGARVIVDASQIVAHAPFEAGPTHGEESALDAVIFSGHKVYAPGSPGVIVIKKGLSTQLQPESMGGGMVEEVHADRYTLRRNIPERLEAGTPNLVGAVTLGAAVAVLRRIGLQLVHQRTGNLVARTLRGLMEIVGVTVYGLVDVPRTGIVSFNLADLDHVLVTRILNDYFNIAVRNECFCAQPYVRDLLHSPFSDPGSSAFEQAGNGQSTGMVRASFGLYSTPSDVDRLLEAVREVVAKPDYYRAAYNGAGPEKSRRERNVPDTRELFDPSAVLEEQIRVLDAVHLMHQLDAEHSVVG
ncbi:MAG TPA: aminotransferase class V-fold PLP-dependent enzyme [Polyangiaceae bacterium]|nr:aminotransferase class V-fold PLP-dependent enzyme [Polyangiaceae bacterium]